MGFGLSKKIFTRFWGRGQLYLGAAIKQRQVRKGICGAHDLRGGSGVGGAIGKEAAIR